MRAYKGFTKELISRFGNGEKRHAVLRRAKPRRLRQARRYPAASTAVRIRSSALITMPLTAKTDSSLSRQQEILTRTMMRGLHAQNNPYRGTHTIQIRHGGHAVHNNPSCEEKWQQLRIGVTVASDRAEAKGRGCIAIARGEHPSVTGVEGSILGLIVEKTA